MSQLAGEWVRGMLDPAQRPGSAVRVGTGGGIRVADGGTGGGAGGLRTDPLQGAGRRAQQLGPGDLVDIVQRVAELGHRLHVPGTAPQGVYLNKQVDLLLWWRQHTGFKKVGFLERVWLILNRVLIQWR